MEPAAFFEPRGFVNHEVDLKLDRDSEDAGARAERIFFREAGAAFPLKNSDKSAKAEPVAVRSDMTVAEAVEAIVRSCIRHLRANDLLVVERREAAALHQVRVSMRRLRAALSLFRPALKDQQLDNLRAELRWFTGELGEARNLDVFLTRKGLPKPMRAVLKSEREVAYDHVVEALQSNRLRLLLIDLIAWTELGQWKQGPKACRPLPDFVGRRLYKWWQRIVHHGDVTSMQAHERHELRIEIKKLRYSLDFVLPLHTSAGRKQRQFYKAVERIQESLGKLNDMATASELWLKFGQPMRARSDDSKCEEGCLEIAQASLDRLRRVGPYWTRLA